MKATLKEVKAVFTEWDRQYWANPEDFQTDEEWKSDTPEEYGDGAGSYFCKLLEKIQNGGKA